MTLPEIPPAHREAMCAVLRRTSGGLLLNSGACADAAIVTLLRLGWTPPASPSRRMAEDLISRAVIPAEPILRGGTNIFA